MASSNPVDILLQFIVQTEWERVERDGSRDETFLASVCRALVEFVNIRDYQQESEENGGGGGTPHYYSYYAFDRQKEKLIFKIQDVRVRSLFSTYHFANETVGIDDGGQFADWDTLLFTFLIYSTSILLWDGTLEEYEGHLRALYQLSPAPVFLRPRTSAMYNNYAHEEGRGGYDAEEDGDDVLPEGVQLLRDAMRTFLPLFPSVHLLERQPALLAALGNLAKCVWSAQERCHGGSDAADTVGKGLLASAVVCPLCYAAAVDHSLAAEAFLSLLEYHYVVNCYTANSHLQLPPPPKVATRRPLTRPDMSTPQLHLGVARRRCGTANISARLSVAGRETAHWWTAAETRADAEARKTLWRHVLAVGRACGVNGSMQVLRRLVHVWVLSTQYHTELFPCVRGDGEDQESRETAVMTPSVVLQMTQEITVTPSRLVHLLLSLYVQDEAALQHLPNTVGGVKAVQRSAEDIYYSLYTLKHCFEPLYGSQSSSEEENSKAEAKRERDTPPVLSFLSPHVMQEAQEALHYHLHCTVYPALATFHHQHGNTVLAWIASLSHTSALRLLLRLLAPADGTAAGRCLPQKVPTMPSPPEHDAVEHIVFVPPPPAPSMAVPGVLPSLCPPFSPAATMALTEAVAAGDLAGVRLLLLSGASRYSLPLSVLRTALQHAGELEAGRPTVGLWRMLHGPLQLEAQAKGRELAERLKAARCGTAAADLLGELAARLWREKVQYLDHDDAAHDRVLRPCLAALSYDPQHPQARVTLLLALQTKLLRWLRPLAVEDGQATLAAPLPYTQLVLRLYQQLTTEEALRRLHDAIEVQCTLDAVFSQRKAHQREAAAAEAAEDTADEVSAEVPVVSAWLVPDFATIEAAKEEIDTLLDCAVGRASASMQHAPRPPPSPLSAPARHLTLADERDPAVPLYVLVTLSSLLRHPSAAAVASGTGAPSRWYHSRHRRRRDLLAAMALSYLQQGEEEETPVSVVVWARVAPTADLDATVRQHGGVYAVLDHDVPPASPAQLGDLYLIVPGAAKAGEAEPSWECVDVLSFHSTTINNSTHHTTEGAPAAAAASAAVGTDKWARTPPIESVDLKVSLVGRSPAPSAGLTHLRCVLHYPPGPCLSALSPLCWLTMQPSAACRQRCGVADCLAALLRCRDADVLEERCVLYLQEMWKGISTAGRQPLWLRRVAGAGAAAAPGLTAWDLPREGESDVYTVDVPLRSHRRVSDAPKEEADKDCCAALADQETLFVFVPELSGGGAKEMQTHLCLYSVPPDGL